MPPELVDRLTPDTYSKSSVLHYDSSKRANNSGTARDQQVWQDRGNRSKYAPPHCESSINITDNRFSLSPDKLDTLNDLLRNLNPLRSQIGTAMMFCIDNSEAAQDIIDCICESLSLLETPIQKKIARLFLVSDILHNCSAAVPNASFYRIGFQMKLVSVFTNLREYLENLDDSNKPERFKQKALDVLGAWREWTLYEDKLIVELSDILLGTKKKEPLREECPFDTVDGCPQQSSERTEAIGIESQSGEREEQEHDNLDGVELDEELLIRCLESKGLSLRWYQTLNLSGDEEQDDGAEDCKANEERTDSNSQQNATTKSNLSQTASGSKSDRDKFKTSKWETVDPNKVANQVVSLSKWMAVKTGALNYDESPEGSTTSFEESADEESSSRLSPASKRTKLRESDSDED